MLTAALGACVRALPLDTQGCPCAEGFRCCEQSNQCVPAGTQCSDDPDEAPALPDGGDAGVDGGPDAGGPDGGPDAGPEDAGACIDARWCWENPTPHARYHLAVWAASESEVWTVGSPGIATRWDGRRWTVHASGVEEKLVALWGSGPADVWAVGGNGAVARYDGRAWQAVPTGRSEALQAVEIGRASCRERV